MAGVSAAHDEVPEVEEFVQNEEENPKETEDCQDATDGEIPHDLQEETTAGPPTETGQAEGGSSVPAPPAEVDEDLDEKDEAAFVAAGMAGNTAFRASISLQRVASVEEISRAMTRAEQSRPRSRRRRQESETMLQWKKDFDERLRIKDEDEARAIEELREQANADKEQWYAQWRADLEERRELRRLEEQEAEDALNGPNTTCWQRMSHIAKSLTVRRESKDLNRMRTLLIALENPPKRAVLQ